MAAATAAPQQEPWWNVLGVGRNSASAAELNRAHASRARATFDAKELNRLDRAIKQARQHTFAAARQTNKKTNRPVAAAAAVRPVAVAAAAAAPALNKNRWNAGNNRRFYRPGNMRQLEWQQEAAEWEQKQTRRQHWRKISVAGDGHCFYRAIVEAEAALDPSVHVPMDRDLETALAQALRKEVAEHLRARARRSPGFVGAFMDFYRPRDFHTNRKLSFDETVRQIETSRSGEPRYAEDLEVQATADTLGRPIAIYTGKSLLGVFAPKDYRLRDGGFLRLELQNVHYSALVPA